MSSTHLGRDARPNSVVDVHVHCIPEALVAQVALDAFESVSVSDDRQFQFPSMVPSPAAPNSLSMPAELQEASRSRGVSLDLVGPWTDLLGYTLDASESRLWTRAYNESLAEVCDPISGMVPIGTIPLQHPKLAAEEVAYAAALGCKGLMVGSDIPGLTLGSSDLGVVWDAVCEAGLPVLMHPTFLQVPGDLRRRGLKNAVGRAGVSAAALADLVYSGMLQKHPDLIIIGSHGGGSFFALLPRILRNHAIGWSESKVDVMDSVARLYWDSVVLDSSSLRTLVETVGAGRVMLGSDAPFPWEPDPVGTVVRSGFDPSDEAAIVGGTASALYSLERDTDSSS